VTATRRHLLLVEDNPADARLIPELLREERGTAGFDVEHVADVNSARAALAARRFDAVLLDLTLPDSHGTETITALRHGAPTPAIIVLTGLEDDAAAYDALRKGAQDYLVKGQFDAALLVRAIRYAMQRHAAEEAMQRTLSLLRATLESSADGIVVIDHAAKIVDHNTRFVAMFAVPKTLLAPAADGWRQFLLRQLADPDRLQGRFEAVLGDEEQSYDLLELRDGRIFEALSMPYVVGAGHPAGRVWTFRDVTERRRAIEELRRARRAAETANRAKSDFLADLSHEIRTPLNTIVGAVELLAESPQTPEQERGAVLLRSASDALLALVGDVLDLAKIEAGRLELHSTSFVLAELIEASLQLLRASATRKALTLESHLAADLPREVIGDPNRLRQILINVLSNAIKFTEQGSVVLEVTKDRAEDFVRFTATDTGIGIPAAKLAAVFEDFEQLEAASGRHEGAGLGLGIARRLVGLMGGRMWAESEPGRGSRFHFSVRLERSQAAAATERPQAVEPRHEPAKPLRVLLADDSDDNRELVRVYLRKLRCEVDDAPDGAVALEKFRASVYDIVLMDLHMPVMDGLDAMSAMRRFEQAENLAPTPILALTADAVDANLARCLQSGYSGVLTKPLTRAQLIAAIAEYASWVGPPRTVAPDQRERTSRAS